MSLFTQGISWHCLLREISWHFLLRGYHDTVYSERYHDTVYSERCHVTVYSGAIMTLFTQGISCHCLIRGYHVTVYSGDMMSMFFQGISWHCLLKEISCHCLLRGYHVTVYSECHQIYFYSGDNFYHISDYLSLILNQWRSQDLSPGGASTYLKSTNRHDVYIFFKWATVNYICNWGHKFVIKCNTTFYILI